MVPRRTPRFAVPSGTRAIVAASVFFIVSSVARPPSDLCKIFQQSNAVSVQVFDFERCGDAL
jgi:hypothetical protein